MNSVVTLIDIYIYIIMPFNARLRLPFDTSLITTWLVIVLPTLGVVPIYRLFLYVAGHCRSGQCRIKQQLRGKTY